MVPFTRTVRGIWTGLMYKAFDLRKVAILRTSMVLTYAVALRCLDIHSSALLTLLWAVLTLDLVSYPNKATCFGRMHCRLDLICDWRICRLIAAPELYFSEVSRAKDDPLLTPHCFCHPDIEISCRPVTTSPPSTSPLSMTDSRPVLLTDHASAHRIYPPQSTLTL